MYQSKKELTTTDSNEILKMKVKDEERFYHEVVQNEFAFAKDLPRALAGGNENIALEKEIIE